MNQSPLKKDLKNKNNNKNDKGLSDNKLKNIDKKKLDILKTK